MPRFASSSSFFPRPTVSLCLLGLAVLALGLSLGVGAERLKSRSFAAAAERPVAEACGNGPVDVAALLSESRGYLDEIRRAAEALPPPPRKDAFPPASPLVVRTAGAPPSAVSAPRRSTPFSETTVSPQALSPAVSGFGGGGALLTTAREVLTASARPPSPSGKLVALTFDDGPRPDKTRRIMDLLEARGAKATFFFIGNRIDRHPSLVREVLRRGFEIGNHSQTHPDLRRAAHSDAIAEIRACQEAFLRAGVAPPTLIRFPYGNSTPRLRDYCAGAGLRVVGWDVDTRDWEPNATADSILSKVKARTRPGSIILMHEHPEATHSALPRVLDFLENEGYRIVTAGQLLGAR